MAQMNTSNIPSEKIRSVLCQTAEEIMNSSEFKIYVTSTINAGSENFIGDVIFLTVKDEREQSVGQKSEKQVVLKIAPLNEARRSQFRVRNFFMSEIYSYYQLLPVLREFQLSRGLSLDEIFHEYPKCFDAVDDELSECIILEDLRVRGFTAIRPIQDISPEHGFEMMKCFAKFHAASFALKDQQPERFEELVSHLNEIFLYEGNTGVQEALGKQLESTLELVSDDAELFAKIENLLHDPFSLLLECIDPKSAGSAAIITHGDAWQNNFMSRYDETENSSEVALIDWQAARHSSPVIDILYFFSSLSKEFRDLHYENCLNIYHDCLTTQIKRLGSDPEQLFPYDVMMEHFRKFGKFSLLISVLLRPQIYKTEKNQLEENAESSTENKFLVVMNPSEDLKKFLREIIVDSSRLGYI